MPVMLSPNVCVPRRVTFNGRTITTIKDPIDEADKWRQLNIDGDKQ
jgi:hypothetical protein